MTRLRLGTVYGGSIARRRDQAATERLEVAEQGAMGDGERALASRRFLVRKDSITVSEALTTARPLPTGRLISLPAMICRRSAGTRTLSWNTLG